MTGAILYAFMSLVASSVERIREERLGARGWHLRAKVALAGVALLTGTTALHAQTVYPWSDLAFLPGCWAGTMGSLDMREQWSEAEGRRHARNDPLLPETDELADFEFAMLISEVDGVAITLWPYPEWEPSRSEHGFPARVDSEDEFTFENLEHDFPVRIVYARDGTRRDSNAPHRRAPTARARGWTLTTRFHARADARPSTCATAGRERARPPSG